MRVQPAVCAILCVSFVFLLTGCQHSPVVEVRAASSGGVVPPLNLERQIRATGTIQAVRSSSVQVPQISGLNTNRLTLVKLVPNGTRVKKGDILAQFDRNVQ